MHVARLLQQETKICKLVIVLWVGNELLEAGYPCQVGLGQATMGEGRGHVDMETPHIVREEGGQLSGHEGAPVPALAVELWVAQSQHQVPEYLCGVSRIQASLLRSRAESIAGNAGSHHLKCQLGVS